MDARNEHVCKIRSNEKKKVFTIWTTSGRKLKTYNMPSNTFRIMLWYWTDDDWDKFLEELKSFYHV